MYIPDHFRPTDDEVAALLANLGAADLISATADGLLATRLPLIHEGWTSDHAGGTAGPGPRARNNRQWETAPVARRWSSRAGPTAHLPRWYATKREHGRVVPTWNYITAHIHPDW